MEEHNPTAPSGIDARASLRARLGRRAGAIVLASIVIAGAAGRLGVTTSSAFAADAGYTLQVHHPSVARGGLAVTWEAVVTLPAAVEAPVTLETTSRFLAMFDVNAIAPEPVAQAGSATTVRWTFAPPGRRLAVRLDARIEPGVQWGLPATTTLIVGDRPIVSVAYATTVLP